MSGHFYLSGTQVKRDEMLERAKKLAYIFQSKGVKAGDVVAVLLRNDTALYEVVEACRYVGAYYVNLNWHSTQTELMPILIDSGAKILVAHSDLLATFVEPLPVGISALVFATPAAIIERYPAKNLLQLNSGDRFYIAAPLYHSAPHALTLSCLAAGDVEVFIEAKFDPERFLADVQAHKITHTYIVPTMMIRLLKLSLDVRNKYDISSLRYALSTGSAWPVEVKQGMIEWFGPIFFESYGASELGFMTLISSNESVEKPGSVGKVIPGGSIKILDDLMQPLPTGQSGLIYVYLPMFGPFKYTNTEGNIDGLHYQDHTTLGDVGYLDEDGFLFINDRKKDMIISGGANIFPAEIEAVLVEMPQVVDCAIFGAPHPEYGEMVIAAVQCALGETLSIEQIDAFMEGKLARFKWPKKLDLHPSLPREDSGKIFKHRLKKAYT
jgi:long-chain acyl-CoA synthetase